MTSLIGKSTKLFDFWTWGLTETTHQKHDTLDCLSIALSEFGFDLSRGLGDDSSKQLARLVSRDEALVVPVGVGDVDEGRRLVIQKSQNCCESSLRLEREMKARRSGCQRR